MSDFRKDLSEPWNPEGKTGLSIARMIEEEVLPLRCVREESNRHVGK